MPRQTCLKSKWAGESRSFSTIVFKNVRTQNMENLSDTKIFYVTKGCLKNLARAKSALRARNLKKSIFGATDFDPPPKYPPTSSSSKTKFSDVFQIVWNVLKIFFCNLKHDLNTKATGIYWAAEFFGQKSLRNLSNLLNFGCCAPIIFSKAFYS